MRLPVGFLWIALRHHAKPYPDPNGRSQCGAYTGAERRADAGSQYRTNAGSERRADASSKRRADTGSKRRAHTGPDRLQRAP